MYYKKPPEIHEIKLSIKDGIRTTVEFTYNGEDLRVSKTTRKSNNNYTPEVTNYLYDRQNVILETDANNNVKARYIKGINYIAKTDAKNNTAYFLFNGHGDVVQTVDEAGTVQNRYEYDIWGNPTLTLETTGNAIRYAGEFYDEETGLYYLRARYYAPYLGRFTTEDSYWGEDDNPLSLNLYTYCENDPIQYVDPTGHVLMYVPLLGIIEDVDPSEVEWYLKERCEFVKPGDVFWGEVHNYANLDTIKTADGMNTKVVNYNNSSVKTVETGKDSKTTIDNRGTITNINTGDNSNTTIYNRGNITNINTGYNSNTTISNRGFINTIETGKDSSLTLINYESGYINKIIGGNISNKDSLLGINVTNYGRINYIHTGINSTNEVFDYAGGIGIGLLITGNGNDSYTNVKNTSGTGTLYGIDKKDKERIDKYIADLMKYHGQFGTFPNKKLNDIETTLNGYKDTAIKDYFIKKLRDTGKLIVTYNADLKKYEVKTKEQILRNKLKALVKSELNFVEENKNIGYYSTDECIDIVLKYDETISKVSRELGVPKAMIQAILFKELRMKDALDDLADSAVLEYYRFNHAVEDYMDFPSWKKILVGPPKPEGLMKEDSSTGLGQIFARTAINAYNKGVEIGYVTGDSIDYNDWHQREKVWNDVTGKYFWRNFGKQFS